jgi:hypothetical protein
MSITNLSVKQLERAVELVQERETLQSKLDEINRHLQRLEKGHGPTQEVENNSTRSISFEKRKKRSHGQVRLKDSILGLLKAVGAKGLSVKKLAVQLKGNENSIRTWIYTDGKKIPGIKKIAPGIFVHTAS